MIPITNIITIIITNIIIIMIITIIMISMHCYGPLLTDPPTVAFSLIDQSRQVYEPDQKNGIQMRHIWKRKYYLKIYYSFRSS